MIPLLLFPFFCHTLQISGFDSVHVQLLNDDLRTDMVLYYNNSCSWPELAEKIVTFPISMFKNLPFDSKYALISLEIIK